MRPFALALALIAAAAATGCAAVHPYERGLLAKRKMLLDPDPQASAMEQHVFEYREGSAGGYGTVGGGCGCN